MVQLRILLCFLILKVVFCEKPTNTYQNKEMTLLFEEGKLQYSLLKEKSTVPQYGLCWKAAVVHLEHNCKHLDEHVQSIMALKFMDCFLQMSGHRPYDCDKALEKDMCMKDMSDRAFNVYTEFYTHTQAICFFLQSQIWHEETEQTIDRLSSSSAHVAEQLEQAEQLQTTLLEQQKESMTVQLELLNNGMSLNEVLKNSQTNLHLLMQEFRVSTLEQKKMLFEVFDRLSSLQNWILGEVSWLDTIIFYIASIIISYIATSTCRTHDARLWIFILLSVNVLFERLITTLLLQNDVDELEVLNRNMDSWIWFCRKIIITCCALAIGTSIYLYCDYNIINHKLLIQIQKQLEELSSLQNLGNCKNFSHPTDAVTMDKSYSERFENELSEQPIPFLPDIKVSVENGNVNSPSPAPSVSSASSERSISVLHSNEKRRHPKRILELQATTHHYNLRRSATPTSC